MDSTFPTRAIILNRHDWREADRLVSVYTPAYGRLTLLARGARKSASKLAAHLEPISLSRLLVVKGKGFDYVGSALMDEAFLNIKQDFNKLYFAGQALQQFSALVHEGEADPALFEWLEKWLLNLDSVGENNLSKEDGRFRLALFSWRLFALLGYKPELQKCVACAGTLAPGKNTFDFARGGLICSLCAEQSVEAAAKGFLLPLSDNCIKLLRLMDGEITKNIKFSPRLLHEWEHLNIRLYSWFQS
jgi:DNA repair protein RecO (recombination protein O)